MKRFVLTLLAVLLCQFVGAQDYFSEGLITDGQSADWPAELVTLDEKTKLETAVTNDAEYLYLLLRTNNPTTINKLFQAGATITFKAKTKPKINAKIEYPLKAESGPRGAGRGQGGRGQAQGLSPEQRRQLQAERMQAMLDSKDKAELKGFSTANGEVEVANLEDMKTALAFEGEGRERIFNYEVKVPLTELFGASLDWDRIAATSMTIQFTVKGMTKPSSLNANPGGGRGGRGGGGRGGGGRGGAGRGGARGGGGNTAMFATDIVKVDYQFTKN